jgi:hypothetical protein
MRSLNSPPMVQASATGSASWACAYGSWRRPKLRTNYLADPKGYGYPKPSGADQELDVRDVLCPTGSSTKLVVAGCFRVIGCERYG